MAGLSKAFFRAEPGLLVNQGQRRLRITHVLSIDSVLAIDLATSKSERISVETLSPTPATDASETSIGRDLSLFSEEEWAIAQRRFAIIKPLIDDPMRGSHEVEALALKTGFHRSTLYEWLRLYLSSQHLSALVPQKRGRKPGKRMLGDEQEAVIEGAIQQVILSPERGSAQEAVDEVARQCRLAKIPAPHATTVRRRIDYLNPAFVLRRRGLHEEATNRYQAHRGEFPGGRFPLDVVQIDHTPGNVILVDDLERKPVGRPWITLAIDVYSRMVVGAYLTFEEPSTLSVAMCVSQAICPKAEVLTAMEVPGEWPAWGLMRTLHCDNAKEFRGVALQRACEEYGIDLQFRPKQQPRYGGHIERLMGTTAKFLRRIPGKTFANVKERKNYDSEKHAVMTLSEFQSLFFDWIVNEYHQKLHRSLGVPPIHRWRQGILGDEKTQGVGVPPRPEDPLRIQLDFMPIQTRTVQKYGVQIDSIHYYDPVLDRYVNADDPEHPKCKRTFTLRRDPRDISKVYFLDPATGLYTPLPYRNIGHPPLSEWELRYVQKVLRDEGRSHVDEDLIFETAARLRERIDASIKKTKAQRRKVAQRGPARPASVVTPSAPAPLPSVARVPSFAAAVEDDLDAPVELFNDLALSR